MNQQRANRSYTSTTYKKTTNSAPNPFKLSSVLIMTINAKMAVPITSPKFTFAYVFNLLSTLSNTIFSSLSTKDCSLFSLFYHNASSYTIYLISIIT